MEEEEVQARQKKEKKELQAKIQALKKSVTKGDKKKKREVHEEIIKLESELEKKHSEELAVFHSQNDEAVNQVCDAMNNSLNVDGDDDTDDVPGLRQHRITKAQKRREKKANMAKERELRIEEQEQENIYGDRNMELEKIKRILKERGLMIHEVPSDGDCLYCAVDHQLQELKGESRGVVELRRLAASVLKANSNEFLPFLSHPDTGEMLTEPQFYDYCSQVQSTKAWGGQVELKALSEALKCCIEVIQAEGAAIVIGEGKKGDEGNLVLTYHRNLYSLGEHYNSVVKYVEEVDD